MTGRLCGKKAFLTVLSGILILVLGFIILAFVNRMADNWAGLIAPLALLAGWIIIAVGLWGTD